MRAPCSFTHSFNLVGIVCTVLRMTLQGISSQALVNLRFSPAIVLICRLHFAIEVGPEVLENVQVRGLCWVLHNSVANQISEQGHGCCSFMFGVVVLQELASLEESTRTVWSKCNEALLKTARDNLLI